MQRYCSKRSSYSSEDRRKREKSSRETNARASCFTTFTKRNHIGSIVGCCGRTGCARRENVLPFFTPARALPPSVGRSVGRRRRWATADLPIIPDARLSPRPGDSITPHVGNAPLFHSIFASGIQKSQPPTYHTLHCARSSLKNELFLYKKARRSKKSASSKEKSPKLQQKI